MLEERLKASVQVWRRSVHAGMVEERLTACRQVWWDMALRGCWSRGDGVAVLTVSCSCSVTSAVASHAEVLLLASPALRGGNLPPETRSPVVPLDMF